MLWLPPSPLGMALIYVSERDINCGAVVKMLLGNVSDVADANRIFSPELAGESSFSFRGKGNLEEGIGGSLADPYPSEPGRCRSKLILTSPCSDFFLNT